MWFSTTFQLREMLVRHLFSVISQLVLSLNLVFSSHTLSPILLPSLSQNSQIISSCYSSSHTEKKKKKNRALSLSLFPTFLNYQSELMFAVKAKGTGTSSYWD